jgi:hypothetical protein
MKTITIPGGKIYVNHIKITAKPPELRDLAMAALALYQPRAADYETDPDRGIAEYLAETLNGQLNAPR